jgi:hypothetical protein
VCVWVQHLLEPVQLLSLMGTALAARIVYVRWGIEKRGAPTISSSSCRSDGQSLAGRATALIIAAIEADAEHYALHELGFVSVSATMLVNDSV